MFRLTNRTLPIINYENSRQLSRPSDIPITEKSFQLIYLTLKNVNAIFNLLIIIMHLNFESCFRKLIVFLVKSFVYFVFRNSNLKKKKKCHDKEFLKITTTMSKLYAIHFQDSQIRKSNMSKTDVSIILPIFLNYF